MIRRPPRSTRTDTLFPYTTLFRSRTFDPPMGSTGYARLLVAHRRPYATSNGYISVLIYNDKHWARFFQLIDRPYLLADPGFSTHTARSRHINERSEERRVGQECVSTGRTRRAPAN